MRLKEVYDPYAHVVKILEQKEQEVTILILTKDEEGRGPTAKAIKDHCDKKGISCFDIFSDEAFTFDEEAGDGELIIHNFDGREKKLTIVPANTACFVRGSVMEDEGGRTILRSIQEAGIFMINNAEAMDLARNKLLTSVRLQKEGIPHPRTSFVNNEKSIELAVGAVGGEFPLIVKTVIGAEGIGVIKVDERDSLLAILQALWNEGAELLLQEYIPIDFDIRTLVLAGEVLGVTMRKKVDKDFRTNLSLGAETTPYKLGEEDQEMILKAAAAVGGYLVGVDHIVTERGGEQELFILEVNGSPGTRSNFGLDDKKIIPQAELIQKIVDSAQDQSTWDGFSSDEAGDVEKVEIEGIGEVTARLDTGNESSNSLHATDIQEKNGKATFKTVNGQTVTAKLVGRVEIDDDGEEPTSKRPVVKLDMVFKGTRYKGTKFNLADRSGNKYPVLIGIKFLSRADIAVNVNK